MLELASAWVAGEIGGHKDVLDPNVSHTSLSWCLTAHHQRETEIEKERERGKEEQKEKKQGHKGRTEGGERQSTYPRYNSLPLFFEALLQNPE